jgi:hypothetical protein
VPAEEETQEQAQASQHVLGIGDAPVRSQTGPLIETATDFRIISNEQDGKRNEHVSTPFHQPCQCFLEIGLGQNNKGHNRKAENFDPSLESYERKIGPNDGNKAVEQKGDEPAVILNDLVEANLPFIENISARGDQCEVDESVKRVSLLQ